MIWLWIYLGGAMATMARCIAWDDNDATNAANVIVATVLWPLFWLMVVGYALKGAFR